MTLSKADFATLVPVRNLKRALKFYTEVLGGKVEAEMEGDMDFASLKLAGSEFWLITPEKWEKRELAYSTFLVKGIKAVVDELRKKGVKFLPAERESKKSRIEGPIAYNPWGNSAFFKDPEGNLLMLFESKE